MDEYKKQPDGTFYKWSRGEEALTREEVEKIRDYHDGEIAALQRVRSLGESDARVAQNILRKFEGPKFGPAASPTWEELVDEEVARHANKRKYADDALKAQPVGGPVA